MKTSINVILILLTLCYCNCLARSASIDLDGEIEAQYQTLKLDLKEIGRFEKYQTETYHPASLILRTDRDPLDIVLRRTWALLQDFAQMSDSPEWDNYADLLKDLKGQADKVPVNKEPLRRQLFDTACRLRRKIAFSNPLLDFDKIAFIKRHRATFNHMCDQYYGDYAVPGGGLFVLTDPFGDSPQVIDLLDQVKVSSGRLKGALLNTGSFLAPELSFDARKIWFAYVECVGPTGHITHLNHGEQGHWHQGRCYHLFSVEMDPDSLPAARGKNLRQLTDGTFNEFDPCLLPNGRLAFISERRGGYLRCGRACPSYTVHDMFPDGTDLRLLSPHENNEWQPSVTNDGLILYTRWDYVDRHGCSAHHPWVMTPDGCDSRAIHGNFSIKAKRADMEMDLRAIPNSHKIIGTAAPHHGQAYGSLVIVDPEIADDDAMAPVKRLTPDVGFPESQGGKQVYATPWPLNEKYTLCVYDASMRGVGARQGQKYQRGDYGIYLLDAFGNKELIYRDPEIACLSPMVLRPRTKPPVVPDRSLRLTPNPPAQGTMAVIDVYDSQIPWPANTRIKALRLYQIFSCSVPSGANLVPHETGRRIAEAGDSVNLARRVLGTVPVEEDGSAYFQVPALKEIYFQALDENGLAVQSMRSATWVQPGEQLVCSGCHNARHQAAPQPIQPPLALRREPSIPKPDVDGTNPFSYPRLVQPVLDRKCVDCHNQNRQKGAPPLDKTIVKANLNGGSATTRVYRSYDSLIHKYAFWRYGDTYRTIPGHFGARASRLYQMLSKGHHNVKLTSEELHRITVWLDSMSNFYGVYELAGGEAQLRGEIVQPTLE